ncbi:MAG: alanine--tRNA ligase [bacterium]|nr:alanine--tRNA ligase [bacterium]
MINMRYEEIRRIFLDYFIGKGHVHVPSASLVPGDDPSLLFTTAGMVQFKSLYSTTGELPYRRAVTIQKCLRAGGKDSDLELVGRSPRHLTFFEMLGHFSFGDYFKDDAVAMAWDFFTKVLCVDTSRIWVSIFENDDDAEKAWRKVGFPAERIVRLGVEDNFWGPAGSTGACGPSSEIYWDLGPEAASGEIGGGVGKDDRYIEVWNAVFPEFNQQEDGSRLPLINRGIDMGAGFERMALMIQGKSNIFEIDTFRHLMDGVREFSGYDGPDEGEAQVALRRVADHARALAFTLSEGLAPSNVGRGYVLRRILRRAMMSLRTLGVHEPMLYRVMGLVADRLGDFYPELREKAERSAVMVKAEEERFLRTLEQGVLRYREVVDGLNDSRTLPGDEVFKLYSTYGIPWEMTREMAEEEGFTVDEEGYNAALQADRKLSQDSSAFDASGDPGAGEVVYEALTADPQPSRFVGDDGLACDARVSEWRAVGEELEVVLTETPFYATAGGQIADTGRIEAGGCIFAVTDVVNRGSRIVHRLSVPDDFELSGAGEFLRGKIVRAEVDAVRRRAIARAHTATHLLHAALHRVIGDDAVQAGSWVGPDKLRFDFNHFQAVKQDELATVETMAAEWILDNQPVTVENMAMSAARDMGAMALFGEKYGDEVRVVSIGDVSLELCGGTHLNGSSEVGLILITAEGSVASGVRRIEAVTGLEAQRLVALQRRALTEVVQTLRVPEGDVPRALAEALSERQKLRKDLEALRAKQAADGSADLLKQIGEYGDIKLMRGRLAAENPKEIRGMADSIRQKLDGQIAVLLAEAGGKMSFLILVPDSLADRVHAGKITGVAAKAIGGRGGGSPTLAQAGLSDPEQFSQVLDEIGKALG